MGFFSRNEQWFFSVCLCMCFVGEDRGEGGVVAEERGWINGWGVGGVLVSKIIS